MLGSSSVAGELSTVIALLPLRAPPFAAGVGGFSSEMGTTLRMGFITQGTEIMLRVRGWLTTLSDHSSKNGKLSGFMFIAGWYLVGGFNFLIFQPTINEYMGRL